MSSSMMTTSGLQLLTLNDDCLLQVIAHLDLMSKLRLSIANQRLRHLLLNWFRQQKTYGDTDHLAHPLCHDHRLPQNNSIQSLIQARWSLNLTRLQILLQLSPNVRCVHLNCVDDEQFVDERLCSVLINCAPNLTCLSFGFGLQISSLGWNLIVQRLGDQLQRLHINRVRLRTLESILRACPQLKALQLRCCPNVVEALRLLGPQLETLHILSKSVYLHLNLRHFRPRNRYSPRHRNFNEAVVRDVIDQMNVELADLIDLASSGSENDNENVPSVQIQRINVAPTTERNPTPSLRGLALVAINSHTNPGPSTSTRMIGPGSSSTPTTRTTSPVRTVRAPRAMSNPGTQTAPPVPNPNLELGLVPHDSMHNDHIIHKLWFDSIRELRLNRISFKSLSFICQTLRNLTTLDVVIHVTRLLTQMEKQSIAQNSSHFRDLRRFTIDLHNRWPQIDMEPFLAEFVSPLGNLQSITLRRVHFQGSFFHQLKQCCTQLEALCVEFVDQVPFNHRFQELRDSIVDDLLEFEHLKMLRLHFAGISDRAVKRLLRNRFAKPLQYLDLFGCVKVSVNSILEISEQLHRVNVCDRVGSSQASSESIGRSDSQESIALDDCGHNHCKYIDPYEKHCFRCNRPQFLFFFCCQKSDIKVHKLRFQLPNTLLLLDHDDPIWSRYQ
jgi:hypothetical protein